MYKQEFTVFSVLIGILLVFLCAGTPLPIMQSSGDVVEFTMWQKRQIYQGTTTNFPLQDLQDCAITVEQLQVMSAFAILSIVVTVVTIILSVLEALGKPMQKWAVEVCGTALWVFTLIVWGVGSNVYTTPLCGGSGFVPSKSGYTLSPGWILFMVTWVLLTIAVPTMIAMKAYIRPKYIDKEQPQSGPGGNALERRKSRRSFIKPPGEVTMMRGGGASVRRASSSAYKIQQFTPADVDTPYETRAPSMRRGSNSRQ